MCDLKDTFKEIGGDVENLSTPTDCWKSHGNSYIRYVGNSSKATYVLLGNRSLGSNLVYTEKEGTSIKQYGLSGLNVKALDTVKFASDNENLAGSILKIEFDDTVSAKFTLTNKSTIEISFSLLTIIPKPRELLIKCTFEKFMSG